MNTAGKVIITLASIATVIAIIAGVYMNVFKGRSFHFKFSSKMTEDTVTLDGDVRNLTVNIDYADVTVQPGEELSVAYSLPESMVPTISLQNGSLEVKSPTNFVTLPVQSFGNCYVTVTVPEDCDPEQVTLNVDAGNQKVNDLQCGKLDVHADAGDVEVENVKTPEIAVHVDAGNMELKGCETETLSVSADAGNLDISDSSIYKIDDKVDAGNIEAKNSTIDTGICKTDLGNIKLSGEIGDVEAKSSVGNVSIPR